MKKFKKLLAMLTALTMAISLITVAPAMAEEGEEPVLTPMEQLWYDTNLVINGDIENLTAIPENGYLENDPIGVGYWAKAGGISTASLATNQAYSGEKSIYLERTAGDLFAIYYPNVYTGRDTMKTNTTYIGNYKILGTTANKAYAGSEPLTSIVMDSNEYAWSGYGPSYMDFSTTSLNITADDFAVAPKPNDEGQTKLPQSAWKELTTILTINDILPGAIGIGIHQPVPDVNSSFYVDDFYIGELIVAGVKNTISNATIPASGEATVALTANAFNQLGTEEGLEETNYTHKLLYPVDGVSINNNNLTVSSDVQAQTILIKVTANPTFKGADNQSEELKERRTMIYSVELTQGEVQNSSVYDQIRKDTNLVKNGDFENLTSIGTNGYLENVPAGVGYWFGRDISGVYLAENQAYSGEKAIYLEMPSGASMSIYSPRVYNTNNELKANTTYISSYKIMGTTANRGYTVGEPLSTLFYDQSDLQWSSDTYLKFTSPTLSIAAEDFAVAPGLNDEGQTKLPQSAWKDITTVVTINDTVPGNIGFGPFLYSKGDGVAFYLDDYYFSELIVANVENTTEVSEVSIPAGENTTVTLTAKAYNQFGTEEGLDGTTYTWEAVSLPQGVTLSDNTLTVTPDALGGKAMVKVTANPTFKGAEAQSDAQKALREKVVTIDVKAAKGFNFNITATGKVTPQAFVDSLDNNAKVYCALYKVENGAKKLMDVDVKTLTTADKTVNFKEFTVPTTYEYELKCFMWYENNPMQNIIPAVVWE